MTNRNFYMRSLRIRHFRGFKNLVIKKLRHVNLIGGLNSTGKTALLEIIFVYCDRKNPGAFGRFFQFRNLPFDFAQQVKDVFYDFDASQPAIVEVDSKFGKEQYTLSFQSQIPMVQHTNVIPGSPPPQAIQMANQPGLKITFSSTSGSDEMYASGQGNQITGQVLSNTTSPPPPVFLFTAVTRNNHATNVEFYSQAVRTGYKEKLLEILRIVIPDIRNIELLQSSGLPVISVDVGLKRLLPLAALGDGAYFTLIISSAIISNSSGILLLDEFDGSIHYSKLEQFWRSISLVAKEFNCQIFATSHSLESIKAAVKGFDANGSLEDVAYIRLDRIDGDIVAETYEPELLDRAVEQGWEVR